MYGYVEYFNYAMNEPKAVIHSFMDWGLNDSVEVDPNSIGQSTGLKDKTGKEIYEGDILLLKDEYHEVICDDGTGPTYDESHLTPVVFKETTFGVQVADGDKADFYDSGFHSFDEVKDTTGLESLEIIGNIYQDPDLLQSV